jgi:hypothetical protein
MVGAAAGIEAGPTPCLSLTFVVAAGDATLASDAFDRWLVEDYFYVVEFRRRAASPVPGHRAHPHRRTRRRWRHQPGPARRAGPAVSADRLGDALSRPACDHWSAPTPVAHE